jgi:3-dehydroquinate dehydratase-2
MVNWRSMKMEKGEIKKVLVINGPNLNLLGTREPEIYGTEPVFDINNALQENAESLGISDVEFFQSNHEGDIVDKIGESSADGIIINPAAFTHTSVAIRDSLSAYKGAIVEVHLSNIFSREEFRHKSLTAPATVGVICGFGRHGYIMALEALSRL